jgi:hypothetical protein
LRTAVWTGDARDTRPEAVLRCDRLVILSPHTIVAFWVI